MKGLTIFVTLLCVLGCYSAEHGHDHGQNDETETPLYYDIGVVHREITTSSPEAQLWFDRGLAEGLQRLGREEEAAAAQVRFDAAWSDSDTIISGSCFCRTKVPEAKTRG